MAAMEFGTRRFSVPAIPPAVTVLVAALLSVAILSWAGARAASAARTRHAELRRAESALQDFADLRRRYEPAVAAESIAWRRTLMELQDLGVLGDERLSVTQAVSRAAEAAGLSDVKVLIGPPDTTGSDKRLSTKEIGRKPAPFSLLVECRGGLRSVVAFLGQLPPPVAATQLSLVRQGAGQRHRISLAVYELTFTNGPPVSAVWSPLERGAPGSGSIGRPGG